MDACDDACDDVCDDVCDDDVSAERTEEHAWIRHALWWLTSLAHEMTV